MPTCLNCGVHLPRGRKKYCEDSCRDAYESRVMKNVKPVCPYAFKGLGYCCWCGKKLDSNRRRWHREDETDCLKQYWAAHKSRESMGYYLAIKEALARNKKKNKGFYHCEACKEHTWEPEVHHKVPVSEGGDYLDQENLQVLCPSCHRSNTKKAATERARRKRTEKKIEKAKKIKTLDSYWEIPCA